MRVSLFLRACSIILLSVVFSTGWATAVNRNIWGPVQLDNLLFNTINPYQSDTNTPENTTAEQAQYLQDILNAESNGAGITQSATTIVQAAASGSLLSSNPTTGGGVTTGVTTVTTGVTNAVNTAANNGLSSWSTILGDILNPTGAVAGITSGVNTGAVLNTAGNVATTGAVDVVTGVDTGVIDVATMVGIL